MAVLVDGRRPAFSGTVHRAGVIGVIVPALAKVPAVIRVGRSAIDLLPPCRLTSFSTRLGLFDTEIEINNSQVPKEVLDLIQADPESTTYQSVLTAYPQDPAHERHSLTNSHLEE